MNGRCRVWHPALFRLSFPRIPGPSDRAARGAPGMRLTSTTSRLDERTQATSLGRAERRARIAAIRVLARWGLGLETLNHFPVPAKTREGFPLEQSRLNWRSRRSSATM